jgi:hypothetical protein
MAMLAHHIAFYLSARSTKVRSRRRSIPTKQQQERRIMSEISTGNHHQAGRYEIRLTGHLHSRWAAWFDGLSLTNESDGTTVIHGVVADQAALHGLLQKVRDVGLPLVSVTRVEPHQPETTVQPR